MPEITSTLEKTLQRREEPMCSMHLTAALLTEGQACSSWRTPVPSNRQLKKESTAILGGLWLQLGALVGQDQPLKERRKTFTGENTELFQWEPWECYTGTRAQVQRTARLSERELKLPDPAIWWDLSFWDLQKKDNKTQEELFSRAACKTFKYQQQGYSLVVKGHCFSSGKEKHHAFQILCCITIAEAHPVWEAVTQESQVFVQM